MRNYIIKIKSINEVLICLKNKQNEIKIISINYETYVKLDKIIL